jgi:hypothetical protein
MCSYFLILSLTFLFSEGRKLWLPFFHSLLLLSLTFLFYRGRKPWLHFIRSVHHPRAKAYAHH